MEDVGDKTICMSLVIRRCFGVYLSLDDEDGLC